MARTLRRVVKPTAQSNKFPLRDRKKEARLQENLGFVTQVTANDIVIVDHVCQWDAARHPFQNAQYLSGRRR
jgi:hypothetical protein